MFCGWWGYNKSLVKTWGMTWARDDSFVNVFLSFPQSSRGIEQQYFILLLIYFSDALTKDDWCDYACVNEDRQRQGNVLWEVRSQLLTRKVCVRKKDIKNCTLGNILTWKLRRRVIVIRKVLNRFPLFVNSYWLVA